MKKKLINLSLLTLFLAISINLLYPMKNNADDIQNITIENPMLQNQYLPIQIISLQKKFLAE